jgi:hypothetical protein
MVNFSTPPLSRDQLVLFPEKLDQAIPTGHSVRLVDEILGRLDWTKWEQLYDGRIGQPPIHPRVIASVILYGILCRIRTSRSLEEALTMRNDFRWLVEGRTIDHKLNDELADGMMSTGDNLAKCEEAGIDLYSPIKLGRVTTNPLQGTCQHDPRFSTSPSAAQCRPVPTLRFSVPRRHLQWSAHHPP